MDTQKLQETSSSILSEKEEYIKTIKEQLAVTEEEYKNMVNEKDLIIQNLKNNIKLTRKNIDEIDPNSSEAD
jgi:hypothetical protein